MKTKILTTAALLISSFSFNADAASYSEIFTRAYNASYYDVCSLYEQDLDKKLEYTRRYLDAVSYKSKLNDKDHDFYYDVKFNTDDAVMLRSTSFVLSACDSMLENYSK